MGTGRVPSYKEIAIAILKNDLTLRSLGFSGKYSKYSEAIFSNEGQDDLFR